MDGRPIGDLATDLGIVGLGNSGGSGPGWYSRSTMRVISFSPHARPEGGAPTLTMESVVRGIIRVSQGQVPENVLNPEVLTRPGFAAKLQRYRENDARASEANPGEGTWTSH